MPDTPDQQNGGLVKQAARWLFQQEAIVVVLVAGFCAVIWVCREAVVVHVPRHLDKIEAGYERINATNNAAQAEQRKDFTDALKAQAESCETRMKALLDANDRERGMWREFARPRITSDSSTTYPGAP